MYVTYKYFSYNSLSPKHTRDQVPTYTYILYIIFVCSHMVWLWTTENAFYLCGQLGWSRIFHFLNVCGPFLPYEIVDTCIHNLLYKQFIMTYFFCILLLCFCCCCYYCCYCSAIILIVVVNVIIIILDELMCVCVCIQCIKIKIIIKKRSTKVL